MTEHDWLVSSDPVAMLQYLAAESLISARKLTLYACALRRQISGEGRDAAALAWNRFEAAAGTPAFAEDGRKIDPMALIEVFIGWGKGFVGSPDFAEQANLLREIVGNPFLSIRRRAECLTCAGTGRIDEAAGPGGEIVCAACQGSGLRGQPQAWLTPTVKQLAQAIYEGRTDCKRCDGTQRLGDALEEAGCTDEDILRHCREGGPHVRGCWVVDLILGLE